MMALPDYSVRDPKSGPDFLHLHRKDTMAPTMSGPLSPFSSSPSHGMNPLQSTPSDTMVPARNRSLHDHRQFLSSCDSASVDSPDSKKLLRRKNAALNLNHQSQVFFDNHLDYPLSLSSPASSPPPLSPSSSPSILSEQQEGLDGFVRMGYDRHISPIDPYLLSDLAPETPSPIDAKSEQIYLKANPHKILDTFRSRLEKYPDPDPSQHEDFSSDLPVPVRRHTKTYSDSMLLNVQKPTTTLIHHGTSFDILNPHESLHFARIVSYIEDVDSYSTGNNRDSYISTITEDAIIIEEEPWSYPSTPPSQKALEEEYQKARLDIGDAQAHHSHHPMPSIYELLDEPDHHPPTHPHHQRPVTSLSNESELGEPGSPIWEDNHLRMTTPPNDALWQYDIGMDHSNNTRSFLLPEPSSTPKTEIHIHRKLTRKSNSSRKRKGPFRKLFGLATALRKKSFFKSKQSN